MKSHQSPLSWIIAIAAVALAAFAFCGIGVVAAIRFVQPRPPLGFRDYVKNPELWHELENEESDVEGDLAAAQKWDDQQIEAALRRFVFQSGNRQDRYVLASLGVKTTPVLLNVLREKRLAEAPFQQVCELLGENPTPNVVPLLAPYLDDKSEEVRKEAALVLGTIGADSIVPSIRKALQDGDEYVRAYALIGMERASQDMRLSDGCRRDLFPDVQRLISEGKNTDHAALLLEMNREMATEFFLSDDIFTPKSQSLHDVLQALNEKGVTVSRDQLLGLIEQLAPVPLEYPHDYQLGEGLHSLGKHQNPEDRAVLERYLTNSNETVAAGAADGMIASHGLAGFDDRIWNAEGPAALTQPQRHYSAVRVLDAEVRNGGFSQYFFNSSGDEWKSALSGLEAMGSRDRLALLQKALAKFDKSSPSEFRNQRMQQLAKIEDGKDSVFDQLETRYYKSSENLDVMVMRYVLKNPDAFR